MAVLRGAGGPAGHGAGVVCLGPGPLAQQLAGQVAALESRLEDRQQLQLASSGGQRGYDLALQMARHGAAQDDIVSATGVTRHEAQLLARLHNPPRS